MITPQIPQTPDACFTTWSNSGSRPDVRPKATVYPALFIRVMIAVFPIVCVAQETTGKDDSFRGIASAIEAARFVESFSAQSVAVLQNESLTEAERDEVFRRMLMDGFDTYGGARFALSQAWRRASTRQRAEYVALFREELFRVGKRFFRQYEGETIEVRRVLAFAEGTFLVRTKLSNPEAAIDDIDVLVGNAGGRPRILDMRFEGLSVLESYRSEFVGRAFRGGVEGVPRMLRRRRPGGPPMPAASLGFAVRLL